MSDRGYAKQVTQKTSLKAIKRQMTELLKYGQSRQRNQVPIQNGLSKGLYRHMLASQRQLVESNDCNYKKTQTPYGFCYTAMLQHINEGLRVQ